MNNVRYRYQGIPRNFWVYGRERAVLCPDYPKGTCAKLCARLGLCGGKDGNENENGAGGESRTKKVLRCIAPFITLILTGIVILAVVIGRSVS